MRYLILSLCLLTTCKLVEASEGPSFDEAEFTRYLYKQGDDRRWAQVQWPDSDWYSIYHQGLPDTPQIFWTRNHVIIGGAESLKPMAVHTSLLGAHEVYWDGQLLGVSGRVADTLENEVAGPIINRFPIPDALYTNGSHVLSLRVSSFRAQDNLRVRYYEVDVISNAPSLASLITTAFLPLIFLGCFLITAVYYQAIYWIFRRDKPLLLFSFLCLSISTLLLSQRWTVLVGYSYDWYWFNQISMLVLTTALALLLVTFILYQFDLKHKLLWIAGVSVATGISSVFANNFENINTQTLIIAVSASLMLTALASKKNIEGALPANCGLVIVVCTILLDPNNYLEHYLFPSFAALIVFMLISLTLRMKKQQQDHESALLASERLKTELLKKNIQPHFMLNSLASIGELVETDPEQADAFIQGLAAEFKLLNMMTEKKLVPLTDELALCQSHAKLSSLRNGVDYKFNASIEDSAVLIPPAIFHTLLENGISHNMDLTGEVTITLIQTRGVNEFIYKFGFPFSEITNRSIADSGTGTKYVRARLEESFPGCWSLHESRVGEVWVSEICLPSPSTGRSNEN